ncbi:response regulator transcription factor [Bradyrhizobium sp. CCGB01]|uniref:LuxR C-terminal-related transcriptional regulator n=1 Tax=Bradyrhizobium sp. CCGB01 TaxID=2949634 RepID=UPI0020B3032E|nr:response regulator transcription factor [Bradyrhizobium sp. CCGB01]MCP3407573.1 response regulator transcription factor [Bradyrhizobium sp. CCGB01]
MLRIRVVIADRRPIVLQGFATLFAAERDFEIIASCISGAGCLEAFRKLKPDVALVEDGFPDVTASEMLAAVNAENIPTRLVFYTASIARGDLAAAIAAGACTAIPMREEPETLMQSLRLVAPTADRAAARKAGNAAFGEKGLAALTDQERKIMRLVACGMSDKELARQLKIPTVTVQARINHISAQLEIKNRTELATFVLSRLYGGMGALAALIWAALDDVQSAGATAVGQAYTDSVTVMAADGTGAALTIKITSQKTTAISGKTAKAGGNAGRDEDSGADSPTRAKLIESRADIAASTITLPTPTPLRLGLSSFGTFVLMAVGVSIYELLASPAQAFTFSDSPSDFFASDAANATGQFAALNTAGDVDPNLNGFDKLTWLNPEMHSESFAFEGARGDTVGRGDELQITDAAASEDSVSGSGNPHVGAGAIDALIDHGGFEQAGRTDTPRNAEYGTTQATEVDGSDHGQLQRDLYVSEQGATAGKPHAEREPPGQDPTQRQSQRDLHVSEEGAAKGKPHAEHEPPEHEHNRGQLHREVDASNDDATVGKKHVKNDALGSHANSIQSQRDLQEPHSNASKNLHAGPSQNAGSNHQATDDSGPAQTAAAPEPGDSFHFKNDIAEAKDSDHFEDGHGLDSVEYGLHDAGNSGMALINDANLFGPSLAEQSAVAHARGEHHFTYDLSV